MLLQGLSSVDLHHGLVFVRFLRNKRVVRHSHIGVTPDFVSLPGEQIQSRQT